MNMLITGANRGLGLELARQYSADDWRVFACCRRTAEAEALREIASAHPQLSIHPLDVTDPQDLRGIAWALEGEPLDILFNNAGVYLEPDFDRRLLGSLRYDDWLHSFAVNTLGAVRVTEALLPNLERAARAKGALVAVMTSHMGSIADIDIPGSYYYRSSKAALNAAMRGLAHELEPRGIGVLLLHPGGVRTRMGPSEGISPEEAVQGLRARIAAFRMQDTGSFVRFDGSTMPW